MDVVTNDTMSQLACILSSRVVKYIYLDAVKVFALEGVDDDENQIY